MAIQVQELFDELAEDFGVSKSSERFKSKFLFKVNEVLVDIEEDAFQETTPVTDIFEEIDLPKNFKDVIRVGLQFKMNEGGEYGREPDQRQEIKYRRLLGRAQGYYYLNNTINTLAGSSE